MEVGNICTLNTFKSTNILEQKLFYERYSPLMYSIAYRICGNKTDAEDILQETFIKVLKSIDQYQGKGSLEGWLRKITVHTAINTVKRKVKFSDLEIHSELNSPSVKFLSANLEYTDINHYLSCLTDTLRIVFVLHVYEGYSLKEISKVFNIKESACRCRYMRAKNKLMKVLEYSPLKKNSIIA
jgi:RNA polymerase sigma factor (sigma-70 family)